uniref:Transmembrane protein n=1 Tax=viral metagenome TaxID=1070528 RepID=A0A6C0IRF8_9ZZZZ
MNNQNNQINEQLVIAVAVPIQDNPNITPRSSLRNFAYDQIQQDRIIATTKRYIQNSINILILLLTFPFLIADFVIVCQKPYSSCIEKVVNLTNMQNNHLITHVVFSLISYFITDIILCIFLAIIIYYFINIETNNRFVFQEYKDVLYISRLIAVFQVVWIILGTLTIVDKELHNVCHPNIYTYTYINIASKSILLTILIGIIISNYYIL